MDLSVYYSASSLKDRDAMFNFIVGSRGHGKTHMFKEEVILNYLRYGAEFIYLRRYKSEFESIGNFFGDIANMFPRHEFRTQGRVAQIREIKGEWKVFGYFIRLSNALTKKSAVYDRVTLIGFDEFIIPPKGALRYLNNEVQQFLDFYVTVDRETDRCKVWFMANAISFHNPYFNYWAINPNPGKRIKTYLHNPKINKPYIAVEFTDSEAFQEQVSRTRFSAMISGSAYEDYAVKNEFDDLHERFLCAKPRDSRARYSFAYNHRILNVHHSRREERFWVTQAGKPQGVVYALTVQDHLPDMIMLDKASPWLKDLARIYRNGHLFFDRASTRQATLDLLNML